MTQRSAAGARRPLGEGAAQSAPTAPHATERATGGKRNGPERFWSRWAERVAALRSCMTLAALAALTVPRAGCPEPLDLRDVEGEAAIPVDLLRPEDEPPPPAPEPPAEPAPPSVPEPGPGSSAKPSAPVRPDAGASDAASADAALADAAPEAAIDASSGDDSGAEGLDGALAAADASPYPRDPQAVVGAVGAIQADVVLVMLVVNPEVIRAHPVGPQIGAIVRAIPQWSDFMNGTEVDPVRDIDWILVSGPSLVNTSRDVVLVHYSLSDAVVDHDIAAVSRRYAGGGPFDAGVRGVRATRAHADRAERVLLRAQPHLVAIAPPDYATKIARQLAGGRVQARIEPGEAVYLRLVSPHRADPEIPDSVTEMRMRVLARADQGADLFIEGDTKDPETAAAAAADVARVVRRRNDAITAILTHGLLDHVQVSSDGGLVKLHLTATLDQIQTLTALVGGFLGAALPSPPPAASAP